MYRRIDAMVASSVLLGSLAAGALAPAALADGGVTYRDVSAAAGLGAYSKAFSTSTAAALQMLESSLINPIPIVGFGPFPMMNNGLPGVAIFDFDGDDDLDLYVTNGPGAPNSLFKNLLRETGQVSFVDVGTQAGVDATDQDSFGTCFGDTDNDGDQDLLVLGRKEPNRFFENLGNGTFQRRTGSGIGVGTTAALTSTSCSMGDVNNDGLLDIVVATSFDQTFAFAIVSELYADNEPNILYLNNGGNTFLDVTASSGILVQGGLPPGAQGITWATAIVDVDLDGDADIVFADDQGAIRPAQLGGVDRGFLHVFLNDGAGHFTDSPVILGPNSASEWMGLSFGDLNSDGKLDMFATSFGDYGNPDLFAPYIRGRSTSRWFLGNGNGTFQDPGVGALLATPFGWGTSIYDYDNDADLDILFHGGLNASNFNVIHDNPGVILANDGAANFTWDAAAIGSTHLRRDVRGVAVGDLDDDGFVDIATAGDFVIPPSIPLIPSPAQYGSPFDSVAFFAPIMPLVGFSPEGFPLFRWGGSVVAPGTFKVEMNSGGNGNGWARIRVKGSVGLTTGARVNRAGIGAVIEFQPQGGAPVMMPVVGGSSHSSQDALDKIFGLGQRSKGTVEVLWPGGVRNRLYDVRRGERILLPEIPCSFDATWRNQGEYVRCVVKALGDLRDAGVIDSRARARLLVSAIRAFGDR